MKNIALSVILTIAIIQQSIAGLNLYTSHEVITNYNGNTYSEQYATGDYPYIGQIGLEYEINDNSTIYGGYIHRSNVDLSEYEYYYDGIVIGFKFNECILKCE